MKYLALLLLILTSFITPPDMVLTGGGDKTITQSGTADNYLDVTCDGQVKSITVLGWYVHVYGCEVVGSKSHGIKIGTYSTAPNVGFVIIENNTVHDGVTENGIYPACGNGNWGSGIKAEKGSHDVIIRNNNVYSNCGEGIAATMSYNVTIDNNNINGSKQVELYIDNSYFVQATGNQIICGANSSNGVALGEEYYPGWGLNRHDITVTNNTISNCGTGIMTFRAQSGTLTNVLINNNIIPPSPVGRFGISIDATACNNVNISNNVIWTAYIWKRCTSGVTTSGNAIYVSATVTPYTMTPATSTITSTFTKIPTTTLTATPMATVKPEVCYTLIPTVTIDGVGRNQVCFK